MTHLARMEKRVQEAEAERDQLREAIAAAERAIIGDPANPHPDDVALHANLRPLWEAARSGAEGKP